MWAMKRSVNDGSSWSSLIIASISITSTPLAMTAVAVQNSTPERLAFLSARGSDTATQVSP